MPCDVSARSTTVTSHHRPIAPGQRLGAGFEPRETVRPRRHPHSCRAAESSGCTCQDNGHPARWGCESALMVIEVGRRTGIPAAPGVLTLLAACGREASPNARAVLCDGRAARPGLPPRPFGRPGLASPFYCPEPVITVVHLILLIWLLDLVSRSRPPGADAVAGWSW